LQKNVKHLQKNVKNLQKNVKNLQKKMLKICKKMLKICKKNVKSLQKNVKNFWFFFLFFLKPGYTDQKVSLALSVYGNPVMGYAKFCVYVFFGFITYPLIVRKK